MRNRFASLCFAVSVVTLGASGPALAECTNKNDVLALFTTWNDALQTGNPEKVADLYAKDGVLLPTVSNKFRESHEAIADYFHHFLELKPKGKLNESHVHCFGDDVVVNSGIYTFEVINDGKPLEVKARYSFVYHKEDGAWKIVSHHSSKMPEPVTPEPAKPEAAKPEAAKPEAAK